MKIASVAPSASADPVSLKTISGSANCVTEFPKFEIVSPIQYFQKSRLSRQHLLSWPFSDRVRCPVGHVRPVALGASVCAEPRLPDRKAPRRRV